MEEKIHSTAPVDFDFVIGHWNVKHRRLNARLCACTDWTSFDGQMSTRKILQGYGNVEDNILRFPEGEVRAAAFRSFDAKSGTWAIWWLDGRSPHELDVPVTGSFSNGIGTFLADSRFNGRPVKVRFIWKVNAGGSPTWEQAFSIDGGESWETNWYMKFERDEARQPPQE